MFAAKFHPRTEKQRSSFEQERRMKRMGGRKQKRTEIKGVWGSDPSEFLTSISDINSLRCPVSLEQTLSLSLSGGGCLSPRVLTNTDRIREFKLFTVFGL